VLICRNLIGDTLQVDLRIEGNSDWVSAGNWFTSLADLPRCIEKYELNNSPIRRILVTAPNPNFAALAYSFGTSREAFLSDKELSQEIPMEALEPGLLIQITWVWGLAAGDPSSLERQVIIGKFSKFVESKTSYEFELFVDGRLERKNLNKSYVKNNRIKFWTVPAGTPEKVFGTQVIPNSPEVSDRWKFYQSQTFPQCAFFGDGNFTSLVDSLELFEPQLCGFLGGIKKLSMKDAARLDKLTNDLEVHFINTFDQVSQFPKQGTPEFEQMSQMSRVALVGNRAIDILAKKTSLKARNLIAFWDTGRVYMQEQALQGFSQNASYFEKIENFREKLDWQSPNGIQIWGWSE
jgi:hypothetical protein